MWDVPDSRRMTSLTSACLCWTLLAGCVAVLASEDEDILTPEIGQAVTLPCRAPNDRTIKAVKWSRGDPGDQYVLLFQDGQADPDGQYPSFKDRVELQDGWMKDGDVSLILKDVTINDDGAYECEVLVGETRSWETISTSYLSVHPYSYHSDKSEDVVTAPGGRILLIALAVVVTASVAGCTAAVVCRVRKERQRHNRVQMNNRSSDQSAVSSCDDEHMMISIAATSTVKLL